MGGRRLFPSRLLPLPLTTMKPEMKTPPLTALLNPRVLALVLCALRVVHEAQD